MHRLPIWALGILAAIPAHMARAQFISPGDQQVSQCVLQYTAGTRSDVALQMIRTACSDFYHPLGLSTVARQQYDNCLLEHLSGAQSDAAAAQIQVSCNTVFPRF